MPGAAIPSTIERAISRVRPALMLALAVISAMLLSGCGSTPGEASQDGRLAVVTTTTHIADLAREIGGDRVRVTALMGPGVDPHLYRASEGDLGRLIEADLVLYHGLNLEGKMGEVFDRLGARRPVVAVTAGLPGDLLLADPAAPDHPDPHVWFDPLLWQFAAEATATALAAQDPEGAEIYRRNAAAYAERLILLDEWARERLASIPEERRVLVTAHDAFGYFGRRYDVDVLGLQGISTESEAGIRDIQRIAGEIADRGVPAVFVETSVSPRTVEAVRAAVASRGGEVQLGGSLHSDALGEPGTPAGSYLGMFEENVTTIVEALA
jgi:manganese/zinc/iron transport system substrate-binding protein